MKNASIFNKNIVKEMANIQQAIELNKACETQEQEIAFMVAGGKNRVWLNQLSVTLAPKIIASLPRITKKDTVNIVPEQAKAMWTQDYNATLWRMALHGLLMNGYTNVNTIVTTVLNWQETESPSIVMSLKKVEKFAKKAVKLMKEQGILTDKRYSGIFEGEVFTAFGISKELKLEREETMFRLWDTAQPKLKPLKFPLFWEFVADVVNNEIVKTVVCQCPNLSIGRVDATQAFLDSLNALGQTGYRINPKIQYKLKEVLARGQYNEEAKRVAQEARLLDAKTTYHFVHTVDYRGRLYARGGLLSFQSTKDVRALWDFATAQPVDEKGLYLHIANALGKDKKSLNKRIAWVKKNEQKIIDLEFDLSSKTDKGIMKALYMERARLALVEYKETGESACICRIDGTCSGVQIASGLLGNAETAKTVNVCATTPDQEPNDLYGIIAETAHKYAKGMPKALLAKYGRDLTKKVIMILAYGAGKPTRQQTLRDFLFENQENQSSANNLEAVIMHAISLEASAITLLNDNLKSLVEEMKGDSCTYEVSDCRLTFKNYNKDQLTLKGTFSCTIEGETIIDKEALQRGLPPNFVHSLDSEIIRTVARVMTAPISAIHDDIGVHSNRVFDAMKQAQEAYIAVIENNPLEQLYKACGVEFIDQIKTLNLEDVRKAVYLFS